MRQTVTLGENTYPAHWVICGTCRGNGTRVNPAIDGNGISTDDEIWQDEDFVAGYFNGRYDVECSDCKGAGKTLEPNTALMDDESIQELNEYYQDQRDYEHERRMGY